MRSPDLSILQSSYRLIDIYTKGELSLILLGKWLSLTISRVKGNPSIKGALGNLGGGPLFGERNPGRIGD